MTSQNVLLIRHRFNMLRIDTPSISAKVVKKQLVWDWTLIQLVSYSMGTHCFLSKSSHAPIATSDIRSSPLPATTVNDLNSLVEFLPLTLFLHL